MYNLSIIVPTIRTHLLEDLYQSFCLSCNRHSFEVIFVGPFDIPKKLLEKENVKYIKDYGQPTRAAQIGLIETKGKLTCWVTDDCFCYPEVISETLDIYDQKCGCYDILGMRFFENPTYYKKVKSIVIHSWRSQIQKRIKKIIHIITRSKKPFNILPPTPQQRQTDHPNDYWFAKASYAFLGGVNPNWGIACLFIMDTNIWKMYGGWDCKFEYLNHATHDLLFRIQSQGSRFLLTDYDVFVSNWYEGTSKDHSPIHYAQSSDIKIFNEKWSQQCRHEYSIDINNWKNANTIWERRFGTEQPTKYTDIYKI